MTTYNDPWAGIRQLQFRKQTIDHPAWQGDILGGGYSTDAWSEAVWGADQDTLNAGGYNSKYQLKRPEEVEPGLFRLVVQQPGAHKYDTAEVYYRVDPETGMGVMVDDPTATRQTSSKDKWQDRLEQRILPLIATVLTAGYGAEALAGMGPGGAGAAGTGGATAADFGMIPTAGGGATYGGVGAAEAAGAAAAAGGAGPAAAAGGAGPAAAKGLLSGIDPTLLQLIGAGVGAATTTDEEQTTTTKNEPWAPAQPWIKDNIAAGQALQKRYTDQPFSPGQTTAYQNLYGLLNSYNTEMLPGLLSNANAMSQGYDRYAPKETRSRPTFGAVGSTWAPGLLKFGG
ncbi:MAG: hypothetical protein IPK42_25115 [Betaproteobacteria bacterium]|nr:hypothetical protein [Betaproteobacteria bacterium]